ncbi:MAG: class I SAM-dependent methyltransferase [Thermoplasmata archaeon]|nr:methyltransferase domain-containing protein [Euryarchaeota archaeon]
MNIFEENTEIYDSWFDSHKILYHNEIKLLKNFIKAEKFGLEIGVGTGRFASKLGTKIGVDTSLKMLKIAKERGIEIIQARGEKLPFPDCVFDYVSIIVTICFVEDPQCVLNEAYRVINNNGNLFIAIIEKNSEYGKYYLKIKNENPFYKYANFFTIKEIEAMAESAGFIITDYAQTLFFPPGKEVEEEWKMGYGEGSFVLITGKKFKK